jgi:hypothetical protein
VDTHGNVNRSSLFTSLCRTFGVMSHIIMLLYDDFVTVDFKKDLDRNIFVHLPIIYLTMPTVV